MSNYLLHMANVLYLFSYLLRDILWLRSLTVVAIFLLITHFYRQDPTNYAPMVWNVVFASINLFRIKSLLLERRPIKLAEDEQHLYQMLFRSITPREFSKLLKIGTWKEAAANERIVEQGESLEELVVIYSGRAQVDVDGKKVATLADGSLVGEIAFLTGDAPSASVEAVEPVRYISWPVEGLKTFLKDNPDLRAAWQMVIGTDLALKLRTA